MMRREDISTEAMERSLKDMLIDFAARNGKMSKESVSQLVEIKGLRSWWMRSRRTSRCSIRTSRSS